MKYIGTKSVEAVLMDETTAIERGLTRPNSRANDDNQEWRQGYHVLYEGGYESWLPRAIFERIYRPVETFKDRLLVEQQELTERFAKLSSFVDGPKFKEVVTDKEQQELLYEQCQRMGDYLYVLNKRIATLVE